MTVEASLQRVQGQGHGSIELDPVQQVRAGLDRIPALRNLPDVDLLVRPADVARVAGLLRARGFAPAAGHLRLRHWGALTTASFAPLAAADGALLLDAAGSSGA
ncbi:MAG: hypothetical protein EXQ94_14425 [Alphaproteobacteria bacterium]|nr:hypothetical protein [Alphaproteobacteria bacterium]